MSECRYVIVRLMPDPIRDEPINVGVIVQSDERVDCRFTHKLPRSVYTESDLVADVFNGLEDEWRERLSVHREKVAVPGQGVVDMALTDPRYLDWIRSTHLRHVQFSEIRRAEVDIQTGFDFEGLLLHLFDTFIRLRPQAKRLVARPGSRLHTQLRRDFRPLLEERKMQERGVVEGTILWSVDFTYQNSRQVAILAADFSLRSIMEHAEHIFAAWSDLRETKRDEVDRFTVMGNYRAVDEFKKAAALLERVSSAVYEYEGERQSLVRKVYGELQEEPPIFSLADLNVGRDDPPPSLPPPRP